MIIYIYILILKLF